MNDLLGGGGGGGGDDEVCRECQGEAPLRRFGQRHPSCARLLERAAPARLASARVSLPSGGSPQEAQGRCRQVRRQRERSGELLCLGRGSSLAPLPPSPGAWSPPFSSCRTPPFALPRPSPPLPLQDARKGRRKTGGDDDDFDDIASARPLAPLPLVRRPVTPVSPLDSPLVGVRPVPSVAGGVECRR